MGSHCLQLTPGGDVSKRNDDPWLVIDPTVERALLFALLRQHGGSLAIPIDEIIKVTDVTWAIEGFRSTEEPDVVHIRLRKLD